MEHAYEELLPKASPLILRVVHTSRLDLMVRALIYPSPS